MNAGKPLRCLGIVERQQAGPRSRRCVRLSDPIVAGDEQIVSGSTSESAPRTVVQVRHLRQEAGKAVLITAALILTALTITLPAAAKEKMETTVYKVEFNIHDGSDGPAKAGRRYTMLVLTNHKSASRWETKSLM